MAHVCRTYNTDQHPHCAYIVVYLDYNFFAIVCHGQSLYPPDHISGAGVSDTGIPPPNRLHCRTRRTLQSLLAFSIISAKPLRARLIVKIWLRATVWPITAGLRKGHRTTLGLAPCFPSRRLPYSMCWLLGFWQLNRRCTFGIIIHRFAHPPA